MMSFPFMLPKPIRGWLLLYCLRNELAMQGLSVVPTISLITGGCVKLSRANAPRVY
jgi:hypothetical protein